MLSAPRSAWRRNVGWLLPHQLLSLDSRVLAFVCLDVNDTPSRLVSTSIRPQPLPSQSFPISYSLSSNHAMILTLTALLRKPDHRRRDLAQTVKLWTSTLQGLSSNLGLDSGYREIFRVFLQPLQAHFRKLS
jgi:hypothetical protein